MPSVSKAERRAMAIAEHHPEELYPRNKGLADMSKGQLHDFAKTKEKGLPEHAHKKEEHHHGRHKTSEHAPQGRKPNERGG